MPPGRHCELNDLIQTRLCEAIRKGASREKAAEYAGVSSGAVRNWLRRGKRGEEGPFVPFLLAVKKAEYDCYMEMVEMVRLHSIETWQAAAWILERRHPHEFGRDNREIRELQRQVAEIISLRKAHDQTPRPAPPDRTRTNGCAGTDHHEQG